MTFGTVCSNQSKTRIVSAKTIINKVNSLLGLSGEPGIYLQTMQGAANQETVGKICRRVGESIQVDNFQMKPQRLMS